MADVASAQSITLNGIAPPTGVSVGAGTTVTLAIAGSAGQPTDLVALFAAGAPNNQPLTWCYLNGTQTAPASGLTNATFTQLAPGSAGTYEWRLFTGATLLATTSPVTVTASTAVVTVNGVTAPNPASAVAGESLVVSVTGGPGNTTDLLALAPAGSPNGSILDWRYLNDTTVAPTTALSGGTVTFIAPATPGAYEIRFFAANGAIRLATSGALTVAASPAALAVNGVAPPTAVPATAGTYVTVDVTNGPGNPSDWVGLYAATAPDATPLLIRYLNGSTTAPVSGFTAATLNVAVPTTAGSYEFRFFSNGTHAVRLATSTSVVVSAPTAQLSVNGVAVPTSTTALPGTQAVVSVAAGPGNVGDYVGLYLAGSADHAVLDWRYLNDTGTAPTSPLTAATLHFSVPTTPGTYEFRFFMDDTLGRLATSGPVVVPQTPAEIAINGTAPLTSVTAAPSSTITATITGGPGNASDWVTLAVQGSDNATYVEWQYLNGSTVPPTTGLTTGTVSFTLPAGSATYEVRLFASSSDQLVVASGPINAGVEPAIVLLSPAAGIAGTVVTITGDNFGEAQGSSVVTFSGVAATVTSWSNAQIVATVPTGATTGTVVVTAAGAASNGVTFVLNGAAGTPSLSPGTGTFAAGQLITITSATPGATIYYTVNGQDPTTADNPLNNGGSVPVGAFTLKARAYAAGYQPGAIAQAVYQRDSTACTYVVRPGALSLGGSGFAGQVTVTPSSEYCDWTVASSQPWLTLGVATGTGSTAFPVLASPNTTGSARNATITIGTTVVPIEQSVVNTCVFAVAPSAVAAGEAAGGGAVTVTASDPACAWVAASDVPWVTLGSSSGLGSGSLTYTLEANPGPGARWSGLTVANHLVSLTQASGTDLTITGGTTPPANALGWHREEVTIAFSCAGPGTITCADPVTVTTDGVQEIVGQASNDLSQTASTTVPVRIDRVPPHVEVLFPRANSLVQPGPVTISGAVTDAHSDPVVVCNGVLAVVSGGSFACTVTVGTGTTTIGILAVDAAGNQGSIVAAITTTDTSVTLPAVLRVSPQNVTMVAGQRHRFAMVDDLNRAPVDVTWTRTNPELSTLTQSNGEVELLALATGTTTLTATWRGLTDTTTVTIVSANAFVAGTTIWNAPPLTTGSTVTDVLTGATTPSGESFLYAVEHGTTDLIRMYTAGGAERTTISVGGVIQQLSGDPFGGAMALVGPDPSHLIRVSPGGVPITVAANVVSRGFAIDSEGVWYYVPGDGPVPRLVGRNQWGPVHSVDLPELATAGVPTVMPDGTVALPYYDVGLRLLLLRPDGSTDTFEIIPPFQGQTFKLPYKAIPDGAGGYLVAFDDFDITLNFYRAMLLRVDSSGTPQNMTQVSSGVPGVNAASWFSFHPDQAHGKLVVGPITPGGANVVLATYNKQIAGARGVGITEMTGTGFPISEFALPYASQPTYIGSDEGFVGSYPDGLIWGPHQDYELMTLTNPRPFRGGTWVGGTLSGLTEMVGPMFMSAVSYWGQSGGDIQQANAADALRFVHMQPILSLGNSELTGSPQPPGWFEYGVETVYDVKGLHDYIVGPRATTLQFLEETGRSKSDAVAFLGHAVGNPAGFGADGGSPGIYLYDEFALTKFGYFGKHADFTTVPPTPIRTTQVLSIPSAFKVLFLGTCDIGSIFHSMLPLKDRQAVIHATFPGPNNTNKLVDLGIAAQAWMAMMVVLTEPNRTVADAVAVGNTYVKTRVTLNEIGYFEFTIYGDPATRLLPPLP